MQPYKQQILHKQFIKSCESQSKSVLLMDKQIPNLTIKLLDLHLLLVTLSILIHLLLLVLNNLNWVDRTIEIILLSEISCAKDELKGSIITIIIKIFVSFFHQITIFLKFLIAILDNYLLSVGHRLQGRNTIAVVYGFEFVLYYSLSKDLEEIHNHFCKHNSPQLRKMYSQINICCTLVNCFKIFSDEFNTKEPFRMFNKISRIIVCQMPFYYNKLSFTSDFLFLLAFYKDYYSDMSVYSGFATRQQQKRYNDYLESVIMIMAKRLVKFYAGQECDESKFKHLVLTIHDKMFTMEQSKYMQPHYSHLIREMLSDIQRVYQSFNNLKQPDQFSQSFLDLKQPQHKIRFNSVSKLQEQPQEIFQKPFISNDSQKTLQGSKSRFKARVRTVSPEHAAKSNFYTPDKNNHTHQQKEKQFFANDKEDIFKKQIKKRMTITNFKVPRIEKPLKTQEKLEKQQIGKRGQKGPLSPRQFLRLTIMGNQNGNTFQALRMKQKHQKIVKY